MKLRNKKTGEIRELPDGFFCGDNLKKICEVWEDYEEPKAYWHIDFDGSLMKTSDIKCDKDVFDRLKEVGNYFDTREEAEEAVEKLKAWKRLKDKGFRFERWCFSNPIDEAKIIIKGNCVPDTVEELDLLFGGEE